MQNRRYGRQEKYKNIGRAGQSKIRKSRICIVGIGGLGTVAAELLLRAGAGELILIDHDTVDESNLQRQSLFTEQDIGKDKARAAAGHLREIDSKSRVVPVIARLGKKTLGLLDADIVLDCTDSLKARGLINAYCLENSVPWVFCSVAGDFGYCKLITKDTACLECFYKEPKKPLTSANAGVLNTLTYAAASLQVTMAVKHILGKKVPDELLYLNVWDPELRKIKLSKRKGCRVCG